MGGAPEGMVGGGTAFGVPPGVVAGVNGVTGMNGDDGITDGEGSDGLTVLPGPTGTPGCTS